MSNKRRTKIEIIRDMLEIMKQSGAGGAEEGEGGLKKTEIVYGANLNFERTTRILKWLIEKGLVKAGSDRYEITEKGEEVLREFDKLVTLFK